MILINWAVHSFTCSSISQKPADLNLQYFHKKYKSGFSRTRVNMDSFSVLFDLILYISSTIFQLNRDGSSWVEPVLS